MYQKEKLKENNKWEKKEEEEQARSAHILI
jgi:hypothetical protein